METPKRRSVDPIYSMCVQPSFIIGTNNEDGTANFAPITWVSVTHGEGDGYLLVISMSGAENGRKDGMDYAVSRGAAVDVPVLDQSRWVYECEVLQTVETGESTTFFCAIRNIQMDERLECRNIFDVDLTVLDPVIYSGKYHSLGKLLGNIGDFL